MKDILHIIIYGVSIMVALVVGALVGKSQATFPTECEKSIIAMRTDEGVEILCMPSKVWEEENAEKKKPDAKK